MYDPKRFPKFDNIDAINVLKTVEIPKNYHGIMGVPISFMDKYCPSQFALLRVSEKNLLNGKTKYTRIIIRRKNG